MSYLSIAIILVFLSVFIKLYMYPKPDGAKFVEWLPSIHVKRKFIFLIDFSLIVICLLGYRRYGFSILLFSNLIFSSLLITISIIDIRTKIIHDRLIIFAMVIGSIALFLNNESSTINAFLGLVVCGGIIAIISTITKGAIGMGDAKLFACIGLFLGLQNTLGVMVMATMLSGLTGLILLTFKVVGRKTTLPFAPFISAAAIFRMVFN